MKSLQPLRRASIPMQRQWNNMSIPNRIINKITKSDVDRDGVPNKWDCQPKNSFKQESVQGKLNEWIYGPCPNCGNTKKDGYTDMISCYNCGYIFDKRSVLANY